jgi:hypothetical protein
MRTHLHVGLALVVSVSFATFASAQETMLKNKSAYTSTSGNEAAPRQVPDVARTPTPIGPVPIPYPNVQVVPPVPPPPAAAGGWPLKYQGPTMIDKSGETRRAPAKIDAITIKQR